MGLVSLPNHGCLWASHEIIHAVNEHLLSAYPVPGTVLDTGMEGPMGQSACTEELTPRGYT